MRGCMYATEAVIRPLRCSCHAILDAWLRVHSSIKVASLLVTASCRDVSAHSTSDVEGGHDFLSHTSIAACSYASFGTDALSDSFVANNNNIISYNNRLVK